MVSSLLLGNMNMAEWERPAHYQSVNDSRSTEEDGTDEEDTQQWHTGYQASAGQPQYPPPYGYASYNTSVPEPIAESMIPFPLYQAETYAPPCSPLSHKSTEEMESHCKLDDDDERKPAAAPIGATSSNQLIRGDSFDNGTDGRADWGSFDPPHHPPSVPSYSMPTVNYAQRPRDRGSQPTQGHVRHPSSIPYIHSGGRRKPTMEEFEEAQTPRAKHALQSWYDRFNELIEYKTIYGDCNVPQKYEENPKLGVVSPVVLSSLTQRISLFANKVGQQAKDGKKVS